MQTHGYLAKPQHSPTSFGLAFVVTGAGLAALLLANPYIKTILIDPKADVFNVKLERPKPVEPIRQPKLPLAARPRTVLVPPPPTFDPPPQIVVTPPVDATGPVGGTAFVDVPKPLPAIVAIRPPVIVDARPDGRYARDLQPPYPAALEREEIEGKVTVRVHIGSNGQVLAVEAVQADHDGFLSATRDWAIRHWRFLPATRDGTPVNSWRTMTVRFNIDRQ